MSQTLERHEINGIVLSNENEVEAIAIFNVSSNKGAITNTSGEFVISVALHDTLSFSSIQYKPHTIIVNEQLLSKNYLIVTMEEQINELDEIVVGKILTGDLNSDINNVEGKPPINFYDVGIPGYTGRKATKNERMLDVANGDGLNYKTLILQVLTGNLKVDPIINGVSGRTKILKERVKLEQNDDLLRKIKARVSQDFFSMYEVDETLHLDFLYFCQEDENFNERCNGKSDAEMYEFLKEKLIHYKNNIELNKD